MTRTLPALAAAIFAAAAFAAPAAEACISCEYVPPVVHTPVHSFSAHSYSAPRRVHTATRKRVRKIEREVVETKRKAKSIETAKNVEPVAIEPAKPKTSAEADVKSENSTISTAAIAKSDVEPKADTGKADTATNAAEEVSNAVGCKKFFPSVGMTLSVPCE